jgi:hypothetical protein
LRFLKLFFQAFISFILLLFGKNRGCFLDTRGRRRERTLYLYPIRGRRGRRREGEGEGKGKEKKGISYPVHQRQNGKSVERQKQDVEGNMKRLLGDASLIPLPILHLDQVFGLS